MSVSNPVIRGMLKDIYRYQSAYKTLRSEIRAHIETEFRKNWVVNWILHSNKLEGVGTQTLGDTQTILKGELLENISKTEQRETLNTLNAMKEMFAEYPDKEKEAGDRPIDALLLTTQTITEIHASVLRGDNIRAGQIRMGDAYPQDTKKYYLAHNLIEQNLQGCVDIFNASLTTIQDTHPQPEIFYEKILYPVCDFIHRFLQIHPFSDGNGRVARLLLGAMYYKEHPVILLIPTFEREDRNRFLDALRQADLGDNSGFVELVVRSSLKTWKAVRDEVVQKFGDGVWGPIKSGGRRRTLRNKKKVWGVVKAGCKVDLASLGAIH